MKFQCMLALLLAVAVTGASAKTHHDAVASAVVADLIEAAPEFLPLLPNTTDPLIEWLLEHNLTALALAVDLLDLAPELEAFNGTIFAPDDQAFLEALAMVKIADITKITDSQKGLLKEVLLYHCVPEMMLLTADFSSGEVVPTLLPTKTLTLGVTGDMYTVEAVGDTANIVDADLMLGEVVVQVVNKVLLPIELTPSPSPAPSPVPAPAPAPVPSAATTTLASGAALAAGLLAAALLI